MRYLFQGYLKNTVIIVFVSILASLVVSAVIFFFANVIFGNKLVFQEVWKNAYIIIAGVWFLVDVAWSFLCRLLAGLVYGYKLKASFSDILEAMLEYKLFKNAKDMVNCTPEEFHTRLENHRAAKSIVSAFMKHLVE